MAHATVPAVTHETDGGTEFSPSSQLVRELLSEHAPYLDGQHVRPSREQGSSNWVFRVGEHHAVRLPRTDSSAQGLLTEATWLPRLADRLPVPVPVVELLAEPSARFRRPWTLVRWVPGATPDADLGHDAQHCLARDLGTFMRDLHQLDTFGLAPGPDHWGYRTGEPVTDDSDAWVEHCAAELSDLFDPAAIREAWRLLRDIPAASMPPCWVHTDLATENLLVTSEGDLVGVVDFGGLGVGDRSADLLYAWSMFDQPARDVLRDHAQVDEATWLRARAWAYAGPGLLTIADYRQSLPARTGRLVRMVEAVAADVGVTLRRDPGATS
jgi:aminoglycoside phosphotransferase (APT) family kinase protein